MSNLHEVRTVRCAHCGTIRQERNHWFVIRVEKDKFRCAPLADPVAEELSGARKRNLRGNDAPACGRQCAQKLFEKYLAAQAMPSPAEANRWTTALSIGPAGK